MREIVQCIGATIREIGDHRDFQEFLNRDVPNPGDAVVLNSSFLSRTGAQTPQSELNLVVEFGRTGTLEPLPQVCRGFPLRSDYKLVKSPRSKLPPLSALPDAILAELEKFGRLPFVLIGEVHDDVAVAVHLNHSDFTELIVDPHCTPPLEIRNGALVVPMTADAETVWTTLTAMPQYAGISPEKPNALRDAIVTALSSAERLATARLTLPERGSVPENHVLASISAVLREHEIRYDEALSHCGGAPDANPSAYNEILRISYNFASDASDLIKLILSLADLKPLVSWCTLGAQQRLAGAQADLFPYDRSRKPSIATYATTIGDTRNSAFHSLFPFRKSLEVRLRDGDIRDPSLLIFAPYGRESDNELRYRDKALIDVLTSFTRARERRLPPVFWSRNRIVMREIIGLFDATARALVAIHGAAPN
jgi:hypothetical protein